MKRASTTSRLHRLEIITARLKADGFCTVKDIADDLGVSVRTLSRDIQILRDQGLPIDADRGRGGGLRLDRRWGIGRLNLNYTEAVDLLVSLAITEQMNSPLFMAHLGSVRRKLMASFSPETKTRVGRLKSRILIAETASAFVLSGFSNPHRKTVEKLHQAFLLMQEVEINYRAENGAETRRLIQPHYLLLSYPVWYVLAWDHFRSDVRTFRCDRIGRVISGETGFRLRPVADFQAAIEGTSVI